MAATRRMKACASSRACGLAAGIASSRARGGQPLGLGRRREQPVVADALEARGQHMLQEAPDELSRRRWRRCACRRRARDRARAAARCRRRWRRGARCRWPCGGCSGSGSPAPRPARPAASWHRPPSRGAQRLRALQPLRGAGRPDRAAAWRRSAACSACRNLPLNTLDSACTGNRKVAMRRGATQAASAPAQRPAGHQRVHVQVATQVLRPGVQHQREGADAAEPARVGGELGQALRRGAASACRRPSARAPRPAR